MVQSLLLHKYISWTESPSPHARVLCQELPHLQRMINIVNEPLHPFHRSGWVPHLLLRLFSTFEEKLLMKKV